MEAELKISGGDRFSFFRFVSDWSQSRRRGFRFSLKNNEEPAELLKKFKDTLMEEMYVSTEHRQSDEKQQSFLLEKIETFVSYFLFL